MDQSGAAPRPCPDASANSVCGLDQPEQPECGHSDGDRGTQVACPPCDQRRRDRCGDADLSLAPRALQRGRHERREDRDGHEAQEAHPEGRQPHLHRQPRETRAERDCRHPGARQPERHPSPRVSVAPSSAPATPAPSTGRPPAATVASSHAARPAKIATSTSTRRRSNGTSSARNATGNTKSTPMRSGSGMTPPSRAPTRVARFQVAKRLSSAPSTNPNHRAPRVIDTPYASSVRKYAAVSRSRVDIGTSRPSDMPYSTCRTLSRNVVSTISSPPAPHLNKPTALTCAAPAKTSTDIACVSSNDSPASRASTAYATPKGTTPSHNGIIARKP